VVNEGTVSPPSEVRERYHLARKQVEGLTVKQRGWRLDVLRVIQSLGKTDLSRLGSGERNLAASKGPRGPSERARASQFTTTDAYIFERELEQLHPDNRNIKANPVNSDTGRGFASNFRNFATGICFCMLTVTPITASGQAAGDCRELLS